MIQPDAVTLWYVYNDGDHFMEPGNGPMPPSFTEYRALPAAAYAALVARVEAAEGALEAVRTYASQSAATCRDAEAMRRDDIRDPENHRIYNMLCEQRYAWEQKAASYDALIAFIDAQSALRASGTREGECVVKRRAKPALFVATTSGFGAAESFLGVYSTCGKAERAVDAWYTSKVTKRSKNGVAWFRFVSGTKLMSNGREFIDGRPFGPNVFFVRPTVVDERWGGFL